MATGPSEDYQKDADNSWSIVESPTNKKSMTHNPEDKDGNRLTNLNLFNKILPSLFLTSLMETKLSLKVTQFASIFV